MRCRRWTRTRRRRSCARLRGVMRRADVDHRVAPRLDRARRRPDPRARRRPDRRARHARGAGRGSAASTRSCTGSSCWKRSWRLGSGASVSAASRLSGYAWPRNRRRSPRQGVRRAADAAAAGLSAAVRGCRRPAALARHHRRLRAAARAAVPDEGGHRPLHRRAATSPASNAIALLFLVDPARVVRPRVRADLHHADDRAADHVRPAHAGLRPPAAARRRASTTGTRWAG